MADRRHLTPIAATAAALLAVACATTPTNPMSFFVTSAGPGKGADLGGLAGADAHCEKLASAVGAGGKAWRAYLSATAAGTQPAVNARDRIGKGPWRNAKGDIVAADTTDLHGSNYLSKQTALTEKGEVVSGTGDAVNVHDMLTGSDADGRAVAGATDTTCGNWTKSGDGTAIVGHHDRRSSMGDTAAHRSWNSSHPTLGCSADNLKSTGGAGLYYCFASK